MKKAYKNDLSQAWKVAYGEWIEVSKIVHQVRATNPSPETLLIKDQSYRKLSKEAREVISITINMVETTDRKPTKEMIFNTMKQITFNSPFIAQEAIKEVRQWVNQL